MSKILIIFILLLLIAKVNQWSENHKLKEVFAAISDTDNTPIQQAYFHTDITNTEIITISSRKTYEVSH
ncbi:MAG: hypothetical protein AB1454_00295 [Candidatus Auribacterota bacterium]|jgi:hypothetical protein|uniref:Uncharacterized protein n=1 Tax=Candidatus Auribacter fodinae TaxID=2093366 RepID=A0A3A4QW40_9BACT|nr:MAG: hypothetical protein C4541_12235 [Candidatus Auribacter fodinae]